MTTAVILWAAMTDAVAVQLITSTTTLAAIVVTWWTQRKRRHRLIRKTGKPPAPMRAQKILAFAAGFAVLISIPVLWLAWRSGGTLVHRLESMAMLWTALFGIMVQVVAIIVGLKFIRSFGAYGESIDSHTEALLQVHEANLLLHENNLRFAQGLPPRYTPHHVPHTEHEESA